MKATSWIHCGGWVPFFLASIGCPQLFITVRLWNCAGSLWCLCNSALILYSLNRLFHILKKKKHSRYNSYEPVVWNVYVSKILSANTKLWVFLFAQSKDTQLLTFSNVIFQCIELHKQKSVVFGCILILAQVSEPDNSKNLALEIKTVSEGPVEKKSFFL